MLLFFFVSFFSLSLSPVARTPRKVTRHMTTDFDVCEIDLNIYANELAKRCALARAPRRGPDPLSDTVVGQWNKTDSCYGSRQTRTSPSDSVLRLTRIAPARVLSDTTHCPMMTSKSVCPSTVRGSGPHHEQCMPKVRSSQVARSAKQQQSQHSS